MWCKPTMATKSKEESEPKLARGVLHEGIYANGFRVIPESPFEVLCDFLLVTHHEGASEVKSRVRIPLPLLQQIKTYLDALFAQPSGEPTKILLSPGSEAVN